MKKTTMVNPYERRVVARMTVVDPEAQWSLKCRYQWKESQPDETQVASVMERDREQIAEAMRAAGELRLAADSVSVEDVKTACRAKGITFVDLDFPPAPSSLAPGGDVAKITWRRPPSFMEGPFDVFVDMVEPNDIRQGNLGDCWLMCALSSLAEFPILVERLFPARGGDLARANEAGVYEVRICKNGEWRNVKVDDYFPCFPEGGPGACVHLGGPILAPTALIPPSLLRSVLPLPRQRAVGAAAGEGVRQATRQLRAAPQRVGV